MNKKNNQIFLTALILVLFIFSSELHAQAEKVWFKPKVYPETFYVDRNFCFPQGANYNNCMSSKGWTLVDKSVLESDRRTCRELVQNSTEKDKSDIYPNCMVNKGWDEIPDAARQIGLLTKEVRKLCEKSEYQIIFEKTPCNSRDVSLVYLADDTKINESEKKAFIGYVKESDSLSGKINSLLNSGGMAMRKQYEYRVSISTPKVDAYRLELLKGQISWGEYNKKRKELDAEWQLFVNKTNQEVDNFIKTPPQK